MDTTDTTVRENDNEEPLDMTQTNYCLRHPKTETNLRCGKCEKYICPECMVQTPVGFRCPDCGKARRVPTYDVTPLFLTRGICAIRVAESVMAQRDAGIDDAHDDGVVIDLRQIFGAWQPVAVLG